MLIGILALVRFFCYSVPYHNPDIPLDVLGIPICFGLLYYRRGWRIVGLALLWMWMVLFLPIILLMIITLRDISSLPFIL
ncbi:MAG: hypothetical protein ABIP97_07990, partial [Chthoniobacterales bacterium]